MEHVSISTNDLKQIDSATVLKCPVAITVERYGRRGPVKFAAGTRNPALAAAIDALAAAITAEASLAKAHTAAEENGDAKVEAAAERKWLRQRRAVDQAAAAVLTVPVDNAADALVKQDAYRWSYKERGIRDIWDEAEAEACLAAATRDLKALAATQNNEIAVERAWTSAREAYRAACAARDALPSDVSGADYERALDAVAEAMERWETMAPPTLAAMTEVMLASLDFNGWGWKFQKTTEPDAWRDLLDGGDPYQIFAARYTLHALRLAGVDHPARSVVPTSGYRAPFDEMTPDCGPEMEAAWREHHDHARSVFCGPAAVYGAEYLIAAE